MTAETAETAETVAVAPPAMAAEPGRPAKPWEWQRGVLRRLDDVDGYLTSRTGLPMKLSTVKLVGLAVAGRCDKDGVTDAAHSTLARDTALGRRAVQDAIECLEHFGWVRVWRGTKRGPRTQRNRYYLCFPVVTSQVDEATSQAHESDLADTPRPKGGRRAGQSPSATPAVEEEEQTTSCDCTPSTFKSSCRVPAPLCEHKQWLETRDRW